MRINWPDVGYGSAAFTVFVLPFFRPVRSVFRNVFRDWVLMRGQKAIVGLREEVAPLRERLSRSESAIRDIKTNMVTRADHRTLVDAVNAIGEGQGVLLKNVTRNGMDSPDLGDTAARTEMVASQSQELLNKIAEKLGIEVESAEEIEYRRRKSDSPSQERHFEGGTL